ncbi:thioredoxin family protein [Sphingobacterium sp. Mn56C]|uniref:thioredoxin family protein n=1 Tax=Sphingobacterium sp. Mn56C TaxID=3395261 RepID=UPI003BBFCA1A
MHVNIKRVPAMVVLLLLWSSKPAFAQYQRTVNDLDSLIQKHPKPVLMVLGTEWCSYCSMQKNIIQKLLQSDTTAANRLYYVPFNAEIKDAVQFLGQTFTYTATGKDKGVHAFARFLNRNAPISYPTLVLLDPKGNVIYRHPGLVTKDQMRIILDHLAGLI